MTSSRETASGLPQERGSVPHCRCDECLANERATSQASEPRSAPGLARCPTCGTDQASRIGGRLAVHYAHRLDLRPCAGSWPAKIARAA